MIDLRRRPWLAFRIGLIALGVASNVFQAFTGKLARFSWAIVRWWQIPLQLVICTVVLVVVVSLNRALNPMLEIAVPEWTRNPLTLRRPLELLHLAAFVFLLGGVAAIVVSPWTGTHPATGFSDAPLTPRDVAIVGAVEVMSGIGVWIGVRICARRARVRTDEA